MAYHLLMIFRKPAKSPLQQLRVLYPRNGVGATEGEIAGVEAKLGTRFPADYRAFLRLMGKDKNGLWRGSDCFVEHIVDNTAGLPELMEENGLLHLLPEKYVCVFMHQGYIATWYEDPPAGDDPPVLHFNEGRREDGVRRAGSVMQSFLEDYRGLMKCRTE